MQISGWRKYATIILHPDLPVFDSRASHNDGSPKAIGRERARLIINRAFAAAGIVDDGHLGIHALRKTWAKHVYKNSATV